MPRRRNVFFDPKFNEWLFNYLVNLSASQKANLSNAELRLIRSPTKIKAFVTGENLEVKMTLLAKVGIQFSLVLFPDVQVAAKEVFRTYSQYARQGTTVDNIESMLKNNVFVIGSRDVAMSLSLSSINCHSDVYILNPGFTSFKQDANVVKANANISTKAAFAAKNLNLKHEDVSRGTRNMAKFLLQSNQLESYIGAHFNLQMVDVMILWLLYLTPMNYVSVDYIKRELAGKYKPATVGRRCGYLFRDRRMIDKKNSVEKVLSYIIMQDGITTVGLINNLLIKRVYYE